MTKPNIQPPKMDAVTIEQARTYFMQEISRMEPEGIQRLWEFYIAGKWNETIWQQTAPPPKGLKP